MGDLGRFGGFASDQLPPLIANPADIEEVFAIGIVRIFLDWERFRSALFVQANKFEGLQDVSVFGSRFQLGVLGIFRLKKT